MPANDKVIRKITLAFNSIVDHHAVHEYGVTVFEAICLSIL